MILKNCILLKKKKSFFLESLISDQSIELNKFTAKKISQLGFKTKKKTKGNDSLLIDKLNNFNFIEEGISKIKISDKTNKLTNLGIEITSNCNLVCKHCYLGEKTNKTLTFEIFKKLIDESKKLGIYSIDITGGEPFTDKALFKKLNYVRSNNLKLTITSNNILIDKKIAKKLKQINTSRMIVSLCGFEKEHEQIYGKKTFNKTIDGIKHLVKQNIPLSANFIVFPDNVYLLKTKRYMNFLNNLGIERIIPTPVINMGFACQNKELILTNADYLTFFGIEKNKKTDLNKIGLDCAAQKKRIFIKSDGSVLPCHLFSNFELGNIYEKSLKNIIDSNKQLSSFKYSDLEDCLDCSKITLCGGGCRGRAYSISGNLYAKDVESCRGYGLC